MKRTLITIILLACALPCLAQWKYVGNIEVVAFGVHDTSLFYSYGNSQGLQASIYRINPDGLADTGLDFTQGNYTTFASAGPSFFAGSYNSNDGGDAFLSTDNGSTWHAITGPPPTYGVGGPVGSNGTYVFAGGHGYQIVLSTDNGKTWQHPAYPDGTGYVGTGSVVYMIASAHWSGTTSAGFWRSLDSGYTWTQLPKQPPFLGTLMNMGSLLFLYQSFRNAFDGSSVPHNGVLLLSRDSGMTWDTVHVDSAGKPEFVTYLATDGKNLFAGGVSTTLDQGAYFGNGLYVSTDTGKTWHAFNDGLAHDDQRNIEAIGIYPHDSAIYISTNDNNYGATSNISYATYYRPIKEIVDTQQSLVVQAPSTSDSIAIYPNPTVGTFSISSSEQILSVQVTSILGTKLIDIPKIDQESLPLDLSRLSSGTYFIQIETPKGVVVRKVVRE